MGNWTALSVVCLGSRALLPRLNFCCFFSPVVAKKAVSNCNALKVVLTFEVILCKARHLLETKYVLLTYDNVTVNDTICNQDVSKEAPTRNEEWRGL